MIDRFKFRFWRKKACGDWVQEYADFIPVDGSAIPYENGEGGACCYYLDGTICEQCTGLRDKNGKLIYEGDIIFINGEKWLVIWNDEDCAFFFSNLKEEYHQPVFPDFYMGKDDFKVIGNIHENKELLK